MGDDDDPDADADLRRAALAGRSFSIEEAIGRLAGPGGLKGASPATRLQQAQAAVDQLVRRGLADAEGALARVVVREVGGGAELLARLDDPAAALRAHLGRVLADADALAELVRMADAEWGAMYGERPRFDLPERAPAADDPYTAASVRAALADCIVRLDRGG